MNMTAHQSQITAQKSQLLQMFGITEWVQKNTPTVWVGRYQDRFCKEGGDFKLPAPAENSADLKALDKEQATQISVNLAQNPSTNLKSEINHQDDNSQNLQSPSETKDSTMAQEIAATPAIHYELEGVRMGEWVLLTDIGAVGRDEQSVWVSLKSALANWASQNGRMFGEHRISYPMNDELENSPALAQRCLDGFVLRLQMLGDFSQKVAFLSDLSDGVDYFGETIDLPTLAQMKNNASDKKMLWQRVTA